MQLKTDRAPLAGITTGTASDAARTQAVPVYRNAQVPRRLPLLIQRAMLADTRAGTAEGAAAALEIDGRETAVTAHHDRFLTGADTVIAAATQVEKGRYHPRHAMVDTVWADPPL